MSSESPDRVQSLATLSDEERAAIEDKDDDAQAAEALQAIAAEAESDDDDAADDGDDAAAATAVAADAAAAAPAAAATPAADDAAAAPSPAPDAVQPAAASSPAAPIAPAFTLPEDFEAQKQSLKDDTEALRKRFKDGEIDTDEYDVERERLAERRAELDRIQTRAEVSADAARMAEESRRFQVANVVVAETKKVGIDYNADQDAFAELTAQIAAVGQHPKFKAASWDEQLREADRRVRVLYGKAAQPAPTTKEPVDAAAAKAKAAASRRPPLDAAPKTIAQVPGGEGPNDMGGEFAELATLEGYDLEDAIARMTPAVRARWAASQQ